MAVLVPLLIGTIGGIIGSQWFLPKTTSTTQNIAPGATGTVETTTPQGTAPDPLMGLSSVMNMIPMLLMLQFLPSLGKLFGGQKKSDDEEE